MNPWGLAALLVLSACLGQARAGETFPLRVATYKAASSFLGGKEDVSAAAAELSALTPDVVALQGLWTAGDRAKFLSVLRAAGLLHHRYFKSGFFGSGLLLVSRYEIGRAYFRRFRVRGEPARLGDADYYGGKGYLLCSVRTPIGELFVANAHLLEGGYSDGGRRRLGQLLEYFGGLPEFGYAVVAMGELAAAQEGEALKAVSSQAGFRRVGAEGTPIYVKDGEGMRIDAAAGSGGPAGARSALLEISYARARRHADEDALSVETAELDKGVASNERRLEAALGAGIALLLAGTLLEAYCRGALLRWASFLCLCCAFALFWYGMYHLDGQIAGYNAAIRYVAGDQR